jgi:fatty acid desaturase
VVPSSVEWPTVLVAAAIASSLGALLAWGDSLPLPLTLAALAVAAAWFNSLQHEVTHGHPTPWRLVNTAMASVPVGLMYPFAYYRESHLQHHRDAFLTDPERDPESYYVMPDEWERRRPASRALLVALQTLAGRMLLGPPVYAARFWVRYLRSWPTSAPARRQGLVHVAGCAVWVAVVVVAPLPLAEYLVGAVWMGSSLSLVRSFAEHRAVDDGSPTAVVHAGWFFSLLFLNNNLHSTHHALPGVAWYRIPAAHRELDDEPASAAGAGVYRGYGEIARRFLVRPTWVPVWTLRL